MCIEERCGGFSSRLVSDGEVCVVNCWVCIEQFLWVTKTGHKTLCREIIAVCSEIHTKHINVLCGQNVEFLSVKPDGTYSDHWALKG